MLRPDQVFRFALRSYSVLCNRTCNLDGAHHLPAGPKIIAMNHTVGHDPLHLLLVLNEQPYFLLQDGLFEIPLIGRLLKETGQIPVHRGTGRAREAMTQACTMLREGKTIAIFPEGREVPAGQRIQAKTGVVRMAIETGVPIVPLGLYVPPEKLTMLNFHWNGCERTGAWQFSGQSYMRFGPTWMPNAQADLHAQTDELMDRIYSLVAEAERESQCVSHASLHPISLNGYGVQPANARGLTNISAKY
jgi:1-acyl-sn-glycerol-3-phosphate acyltransferase